MGKSQRDKGARVERLVTADLSNDLGFVVKRELGQAREGGIDVKIGKFRGEIKARKAFSIQKFMDQCQAACEPGEIGIVFLRGDGKETLVLTLYRDYIPLMRGELGNAP